MPKFVIAREIPGAGRLSPVTEDKIYCVYIAPDEATVREHATQGGFPANRVSPIGTVIDPTTSE